MSRLRVANDELLDASLSKIVHPSVHSNFLCMRICPGSGDRFRLADIVDLLDDIGFDNLVQRLVRRARGKIERSNECGKGAQPAREWGGCAGVSGSDFGCFYASHGTSAVGVTDENDVFNANFFDSK